MDMIDKLNEKFDTRFDVDKEEKQLEQIQEEVKDIEQKKNELEAKTSQNFFQDKQYIRDEIKTLVAQTRCIITKLEEELQIGCSSKYYEAYAKLVDSVGNQFKQLIDLNKNIAEIQVEMGRFNLGNMGKSDTISLRSDQLLDIIEKAQQNSQLNKIEAKFDVKEE